MRLITLNTWGGRVRGPLIDFFSKNQDVDIFCLQEIYHNAPSDKIEKEYQKDIFKLYSEIGATLSEHTGYFKPHIEDWYGLAIFIKKEINLKKEGDFFVYTKEPYLGGGDHSRNVQYLTFEYQGSDITVMNLHGFWNGKGKTDTEERLVQSKKIVEFMESIPGKKILCGDLNLRPDTESIKILERSLKNLIKEYGVTSTRSKFYTKNEGYADYILISPSMEIKSFNALKEDVSDHLPLFLEF